MQNLLNLRTQLEAPQYRKDQTYHPDLSVKERSELHRRRARNLAFKKSISIREALFLTKPRFTSESAPKTVTNMEDLARTYPEGISVGERSKLHRDAAKKLSEKEGLSMREALHKTKPRSSI